MYEVSGSFTKSGTYKVYGSSLTMGLLKVVAYKQPDFTYQMFEKYINWVNIGMNSTFHPAFASKTMYYSMKISGFLTCLESDTYEIFLVTNKKAEMYLDGIQVISKTQDETTKRFVKDLFNNRFYDFEIRIIVDETIPELGGVLPYVKLRWSSQNMVEMDIKPRNFYFLNPFKDNGSHLLGVKASVADPVNSIVVDTTADIIGIEYQEERRLNYKIISVTSNISGYVVIKDIYGKA